MADAARDALITGIGIVSCLGEGPQAHWQGLASGQPHADAGTLPPYVSHRIGAINFDDQIPKKGDQRQMEQWQRIGTYAAGLALQSAQIKGNSELLARTDMIVAAGGGERDYAADSAILSARAKTETSGAILNERLMNDLRPTLFLAQLANLLAGNISIVHGVTGSSRTFMGEETAGFNAMQIALTRINAGQSDIMLVGGAYNSERPDLLMLYEFGGYLLKQYAPVWKRGPKGGFALGSLGAFLVMESRASVEGRGAKSLARVAAVLADRSSRKPGSIETTLSRMWSELGGDAAEPGTALISGATGAEPATAEERAFVTRHPQLAVRAPGSYLGHALEPQFVMNIALAAVALDHGTLFPPGDDSGVERPMTEPLKRLVVTGVGHWRGEAMALVEAP